MSSSRYGIIIKKTPIGTGKDKSALEVGTLVHLQTPHNDSSRSFRFSVKEYEQKESNPNSPSYCLVHECPSTNIMKVLECLWPYVISIPISERNKFLQSKDKDFVLDLKKLDPVYVDGTYFNRNVHYDCIVRYIGVVEEMSKGYYFALEILDLDFYGDSPQTEDIPFAPKYCDGKPAKHCFIVPANFLLKNEGNEGFIKVESKRKTGVKNVLNKMKPKSRSDTVNSYSYSEEKSEGILRNENKADNQQVEAYNSGQMNKKIPKIHMTYEVEKNIVVIEKEESHPDVVVVNSKQQLELYELLNGTWPKTGGAPCEILNRERGTNQTAGSFRSNKTEKSKTIKNRTSNNEKFSGYTTSELTKLDTATGGARIQDSEKNKARNSNLSTYTNGAFSSNSFTLPGPEIDSDLYEDIRKIPGTQLEIGSLIVIEICKKMYGLIKWIGKHTLKETILVGVELEEIDDDNHLTLTDGTHKGKKYFNAQGKRAIFVEPEKCLPDDRFNEVIQSKEFNEQQYFEKKTDPTKMFGNKDCPIIKGSVAPLQYCNVDDLELICGEFKGIQGHNNSCYLDATLFAMFTFTSVFDSLLFRPPSDTDIESYVEVQQVLREEIVNPLRKSIFVRADRVMKLRRLLEKLSSVRGLTNEEKDPEEFLNSLLAQILKVEPFLKLSSGQDAYFYQLFVEKDEKIKFPNVQELFDQSFLSSDIKLKIVPSCLIIQMPRFGKNYRMYPRIFPSQELDVTDIIEGSPRQCTICGKLAYFECRDCFRSNISVSLENTSLCKKCLKIVHGHGKRQNHSPKELSVPEDFIKLGNDAVPPRIQMELFAVVCIETSHYVSFVKAGTGKDAPWCFFDSMADRKGEENGYNIPKIISVPELPNWISEEGAKHLNEEFSIDKLLPEHAKRLFCDAYMCMYQSKDIMMYQ